MLDKKTGIAKFLFMGVIILLYFFNNESLSDNDKDDDETRIKTVEKELDKLKKQTLLIIPLIQTLLFRR